MPGDEFDNLCYIKSIRRTEGVVSCTETCVKRNTGNFAGPMMACVVKKHFSQVPAAVESSPHRNIH